MTEWTKLPDRKTPAGQDLHTEVAEIDGETWHHGNIPPYDERDGQLIRPKRNWIKRILFRRR